MARKSTGSETEATDRSKRSSTKSAGRNQPPARARKKLRLMLVDDHPLWRDGIREILETKGGGTVVAEASKGEEVVPVAKRARPEVVVMDMGLPGLDGAGATRQLLEILPEIKVLVLSASDRESDVLEAVRAGAGSFRAPTVSTSVRLCSRRS